MTGRAGDAALAATCSLVASLGLCTLVQPQGWVTQAAWLVALVALSGVGLRRIGANGLVVLLGQLTVVGLVSAWTHAGSTTWYALPTPATVQALGSLLQEFGTTVYSSAAPMSANPGVEFAFALAATAVAVAVDHVAVTRRAPAAAGIPLLAAFLATAANNATPVSPLYFVAAATAWLVLLARQGRWTMRRWSSTVANPLTPTSDPADLRRGSLGFGTAARRLGVTTLVLAVALPAVVPHLPTRFLLDGLARSSEGRGNVRMGYSSTLDVGRSLTGGSTAPVLTYRTTASQPPPLRVLATTDYDGTSWARPRPVLGRAARLDLSDRVERVSQTLTVENNTLDPPALATAQPVVAVDLGGAGWQVDESTSDVYVRGQASAYSTTYLEPQLTPALLRDGVDGTPGPDRLPTSERLINQSLAVDRRSEARVRAALAAALAQADPPASKESPYDAAVAIQEWLRSGGGFTYSLTLVEPTTGGPSRDPISRFLDTKTGYCVQFASAMVMMARAAGIPARMAIGFLPGTVDGEGRYAVTAADAHSWPELYFPAAGWVRFEPTPASRTGSPPSWTQPAPAPTGPDAAATTTPTDTDATTASSDKPRVEGIEDEAGLTEIDQPWWDRVVTWFGEPAHLVLLALGLGGCGALVLPATAYLLRRRRTSSRRDDRVEAQWADLTARLEDLGMRPPVGATLREAQGYYRSVALLDEPAGVALARIVATVERARYARPGQGEGDDLGPDVRRVAHSATRTRSWPHRVRALLTPGEAVRWWHGLRRHVADRLWRLVDVLTRPTGRLRLRLRGHRNGRPQGPAR